MILERYIKLNFGVGTAMPPNEVIDFVLERPFVFAITKVRFLCSLVL